MNKLFTEEIIEIRIGNSFINPEQAEKNLNDEIGIKSFDEVKVQGKKIWNSYLRKVMVEGGTEDQKKIFYSFLYRALLFPRIFYEYDQEFTILAENNSEKNYYIQSAGLNGKEYSRNWLSHSDLTNGGLLSLIMSPNPNKQTGIVSQDRPYSLSNESK